jgi:hypothetical protein
MREMSKETLKWNASHRNRCFSRINSLKKDKTLKSKFMNSRVKIKVIKKGAVKIIETPVVTEENQAPDTSQLTSTVSTWINEFQQRRREETETAFEQLYS